METHTNKRKYGLLFKFGIIFLVFIILTLTATGIATYANQTQIYQKQQEQTLQSLAAYLAVNLEADGNDFAEYQEYFIEHCQDMDIPADFTEQDALESRQKYERMFAETYPAKVFGEDIKFEELTQEIQNAYAIYNHEYYLLLFEKANELFNLTYTYYFVPTGEGVDVMFVLDGVRELKDDTNIDLGIIAAEQKEEHEKMWEAWNTGNAPSEPESCDTEYGKTYAWYYPLYINGEKLGLIGTEVEIADYNKAIAINTVHQLITIAVILFLTSVIALLIIHHRYISKISQLSKSVECYATYKDPSIAKEIRLKGTNELCMLSNQTSDMILELDEYMKNLVKATDELSHTRRQVDIESELARKDALTGIRNRNAYEEELQRLTWRMQKDDIKFGFAVIDVNFLKLVNDTYGHEMGNITICKCCEIVCHIFVHSPVFRIGGDEFVVILENEDYRHIEELIEKFNTVIENTDGEPWEKISAAIGYAVYTPDIDDCVENVFNRADKAMYLRKSEMKALR
ncbi:MAG: GGDEF domain-containing protein [Oscillospiraceae bacterium]